MIRIYWNKSNRLVEREKHIFLFKEVVFFENLLLFRLICSHLLYWKWLLKLQNVAFSYFDLEDGVDNSGVPSKVVSLNATATLHLYNPSRFFGYHVRGSPIGIGYLDLTMAGGQVWHLSHFCNQLFQCQCLVTVARLRIWDCSLHLFQTSAPILEDIWR